MNHARPTTIIKRRGLAPLELVLSLPLLMMLTALMIIMGTAGAWKVRTLANSRQAILRGISPRSTDGDVHPANWWPDQTTMSYVSGGGASPFQEDPYVDHFAVRGPYITDPGTGNALEVFNDTMDMTDGLRHGSASIDHDPPLWQGLGTRNQFSRATVMFVGLMWRWGDMANWSPDSRRIPRIYDFDMSLWNPQAAAMTVQARDAILYNPNRPSLVVLDHDAELGQWYGHYFEFHPHPPHACTNVLAELRQNAQQPMIESIRRVPRSMASTFLQMYQEQLAILEATTPRPPGYNQQKAFLEERIRQLEAFLQTVP
jgi:hypothetical protein